MALKRLDEEFELKPGTQLLPYMKRLLPSLEGRFQALEAERKTFDMAVSDMRSVALLRINEILIPATEAITEVTKLGFLLGPSSSSVLLEIGMKTFIVNEGPQRETFTPSPYVIVEREANVDDYAIARVLDYSQETGELILNLTAVHGNPGPWNDWVISSTPGMADSTKLYHDAIAPMYSQVESDTVEVRQARDDVLAAAEALENAGLDAQNFVRIDGTKPFIALQAGVHPAQGANDTYLATTAWSRARMIEYAAGKVNRAGDSMGGPLLLSGAPTQANHAANKAYVDAAFGYGGTINGMVTINMAYPLMRMQPTGPSQWRIIEARSSTGITRWNLVLGDATPDSGGNVGSNFCLYRYADSGAYVDTSLTIMRDSGAMYCKALNISGGLSMTNGNATLAGDAYVYRPGAPNTGVVFLNAYSTAYHHFDGATHQLTGGGLSIGASPLYCGHMNTYSIYTQGYGITCWGLTSHGAMTVNGQTYLNGNLRLYGAGSNYLEFYDSDWGPMFIHHNGDLIGYLNNGGGWIHYVTNAGHMWTAQYGWLHDYVNGTASNYAWSVGNYYWGAANGTFVNSTRWVYAGYVYTPDYGYGGVEPFWGGALSGWSAVWGNYVPSHYWGRILQILIGGNWYTTGYT